MGYHLTSFFPEKMEDNKKRKTLCSLGNMSRRSTSELRATVEGEGDGGGRLLGMSGGSNIRLNLQAYSNNDGTAPNLKGSTGLDKKESDITTSPSASVPC